MNNIGFKQGDITDFESFYSLFSLSLTNQFPHYGPNVVAYYLGIDYPKDSLKEQVEKGKKIIFLAINDEKKVIGYLYAGKCYGGVSTAFWLAVEPAYQKKGLASKLLTMWKDTTVLNGGHQLHLWTTKEKISFYKKRGFSLIGEFPEAWFGVTLYALYKKLQNAKEENYLKDFLKSTK